MTAMSVFAARLLDEMMTLGHMLIPATKPLARRGYVRRKCATDQSQATRWQTQNIAVIVVAHSWPRRHPNDRSADALNAVGGHAHALAAAAQQRCTASELRRRSLSSRGKGNCGKSSLGRGRVAESSAA